jgi:hypothetical protein
LSVTELGSLMKASLGAVLEDVVEVTQRMVPPTSVATQPAGRAGAVTPSKFSLKATPLHGVTVGKGDGVPVAVAVAVAVGVGVVAGVGLAQPASV